MRICRRVSMVVPPQRLRRRSAVDCPSVPDCRCSRGHRHSSARMNPAPVLPVIIVGGRHAMVPASLCGCLERLRTGHTRCGTAQARKRFRFRKGSCAASSCRRGVMMDSGWKLDPVDGRPSGPDVGHGHHLAVVRGGRHLEFRRQRGWVNGQRMIPRDWHVGCACRRTAGQCGSSSVGDCLPCMSRPRVGDGGPVCLADGLVAEADAQHRHRRRSVRAPRPRSRPRPRVVPAPGTGRIRSGCSARISSSVSSSLRTTRMSASIDPIACTRLYEKLS